MNSPATHPLKGILLSALAFSLWSCSDALVKSLGARLALYTLGFWTEIVAIALLLVLGLSGRMGTLRQALTSPHLKWYMLRGVLRFFQLMSGMYCFTHMPLAKTYTLFFTAPLMTVALAALLMRERAAAAKWLALLFGFCGVLVVLRPGLIALDVPAVIALVNSLIFALMSLIARHAGQKEGGSALGLVLVTELVTLAAIAPLYAAHFVPPAVSALPWIVVMGALGTAGFLLLTQAYICAPAAIVAPFHYIQMLWGLFFGYVFFVETPDRFTILGAVIIIASGLWLIRHEQNTAADPRAPIDSRS